MNTNVTNADGPPERDEGVPVEGDDGLRRRERHHVARARQRQHGERPAAELGVVEPLDHERAEEERAGGADHADCDDEHRQRRSPARNSTSSLRAASLDSRGSSAACTAWNMNSGIRASRTPYANWVTSSASSVVGEQGGGNDTGVEERGGEHRADQQPAEVRRDLVPARPPGPGRVLRCPRAATKPTATSGASATANPYGPAVVMPMAASIDAEHDAHDAVGSHDDGVVAEASGTRADAAGEVGRRVGDERHGERHHHHPVAVEVVLGDHRAQTARSEEDDAGEHRAERHDPPDDGSAALTVGPAVDERPAELLLEREEEPGRQRERGEPQRRDRVELLVTAERTRADLEERVGRDARDQQRDADGEGALGEWSAALHGFGSGGHQDHEGSWRPCKPGVMRRGADQAMASATWRVRAVTLGLELAARCSAIFSTVRTTRPTPA